MKKMAIYEPALCCDTGLCGVNVDPELLRITTVLATLKEKGTEIDRFNLNNAPMEFVKNHSVNQKLNADGVEVLPIVIIDGEIVITGRYPQNDEILNLLELPAETLLRRELHHAAAAMMTAVPTRRIRRNAAAAMRRIRRNAAAAMRRIRRNAAVAARKLRAKIAARQTRRKRMPEDAAVEVPADGTTES